MFNKVAFESSFNSRLIDLRNSEKITRAALLDLSRKVWEGFHHTEDVAYLNRILEVLTPVNRKVCIAFFREFSGFRFDEKEMKFIKKDKKHYEEKKASVTEWLDDPLNNIWSWSERNIEIEAKEFDASRLKKQAESLLKKAENNGFKKADVLRAMMDSGITEAELIEFVESLGFVEVKN